MQNPPTTAMLALAFTLAGANLLTANEPVPTFVKNPTARRVGGATKIEFEISRPTDVAVAVEDLKGTIVRHLAAGVLGKNPPPPLQPNALAQSLEWDGKDDFGAPVPKEAGPFQ